MIADVTTDFYVSSPHRYCPNVADAFGSGIENVQGMLGKLDEIIPKLEKAAGGGGAGGIAASLEDALGNMEEHLCWLARATGGLCAGQVVFLGSPAAAVPAVPGVLEVRGPQGSVLLARFED